MANALSMDQALIEKLNSILEANLDKEHFGVKELAKEVGLSRSQLNRKLQSISGKSTSRYMREFRLEKAMTMLQGNVATASEIAYRVGFSSPTYFNTCFREYYGYTPGEVKFRNTKEIVGSKDALKEELNKVSKTYLKTRLSKKRIFSRRMVWINTVFILVLSVVSYNLYQKYNDQGTGLIHQNTRVEKSIAIMPFKNLSESQDDVYLTMGITASLQNQLSTIKGLKVISGNSMEKYANTYMAPSEITEEIDVTYILDGSVQKYGDSIKVIIHFINARKNHQLTSLVYLEQNKNLFELQSNIAKQVVDQLNFKLTEEEIVQLDKKPTDNLEAYNLYLKGRFFWQNYTSEGIKKSIHYFNQALKLDSTYALAYAGLADSYFETPQYLIQTSKSDSLYILSKNYAERALSINSNLAQAHATLGRIYCFKDWNWEDSEREFKLAIKLDPNYAPVYQYYAELLQILGRFQEARKALNYAMSLNPNSYRMTEISAWMYADAGKFEEAILEANRAFEFDNNRASPLFIKLSCYSFLGMGNEFINTVKEHQKIRPLNDSLVHNEFLEAYKNSGIKGYWKLYTDKLIKTNRAYKMPTYMSATLAGIGEDEEALKWLELAYEKSLDNIFIRNNLIHTKYMYNYKHLREHPKFLEILDKLNLGGYEQ